MTIIANKKSILGAVTNWNEESATLSFILGKLHAVNEEKSYYSMKIYFDYTNINIFDELSTSILTNCNMNAQINAVNCS